MYRVTRVVWNRFLLLFIIVVSLLFLVCSPLYFSSTTLSSLIHSPFLGLLCVCDAGSYFFLCLRRGNGAVSIFLYRDSPLCCGVTQHPVSDRIVKNVWIMHQYSLLSTHGRSRRNRMLLMTTTMMMIMMTTNF